MTWLKGNWHWLSLNSVGGFLMAGLVLQALGSDPRAPEFDRLLVASGKWAARFLLLSLLMTPLSTAFGWRRAVSLRRPAGLWAFAMASSHLVFNILATTPDWLRHPIPDPIAALGVVALAILTSLASTSTRWAMRQLGKWWKRLHRLVYAAAVLALIHAFLEAPSKRVAPTDPRATMEVLVYVILLLALLTVRITPIRSRLRDLVMRYTRRQAEPL